MMNPQEMADFMNFYQAFQAFQQMQGNQSMTQGVAAATETIHNDNNDQVAALQAQIASLQEQLQAANQQLSDIKAQLPDKSAAMLSQENPTTGKNYTLAEVVGVEMDADAMLRDTVKRAEAYLGQSINDVAAHAENLSGDDYYEENKDEWYDNKLTGKEMHEKVKMFKDTFNAPDSTPLFQF